MIKLLPNGWRIVKIEDIAKSLNAGGTPRRSKKEYWEKGNIPWIKISDMKKKYINKSEEFITSEGLKNSSAKLFPKKTVLYSIFATLGKVAILDIVAATNQAIVGIIPNKEIVDTEYLYYCLKAEKYNILKKKSHSTQDNINLTILKNHKILLPPLPVQKKIVAILDRAERLKQMREEANKETSKIIQAIFYKMFGDPIKNEKKYPIKKLEEVCIKITDGSHYSPKILDSGYPFLTVSNIIDDKLSFEDCKRISEADYLTLVKNGCKPIKDDVLFSKDGTVGKVAIIEKEGNFVLLSSIAILRPNKKIINPYFLKEFMKSNFCFQQAVNMKTGSALRRIILKDIKRIKIILPPIELQNKFASIVKKIESLKERQRRSTEEVDNLFNALMQKAFKGELVA